MANILIIDDSPTEVHVFKTMLEKNGHSVHVAETGEAGIEKAKEIYIYAHWSNHKGAWSLLSCR